MIGFVFGAIAGAAAAWYWRRDIEGYMKEKMPDLRTRAADRLQSIEKGAEGMIDRAKTGVVSRMRAGEDRLRGSHEQGGGGTGRTGTTGSEPYGAGGAGTTGGGTGGSGPTGGLPQGGYGGGPTGGPTPPGSGKTTGQGQERTPP